MGNAIDSMMYGEGWAVRDARGRRVALYGPWARVFSSKERTAFPRAEFAAVQKRMRTVTTGFMVLMVLLSVGGLGAFMASGVLAFSFLGGMGSMLTGVALLAVVATVGAHHWLAVPANTATFVGAMLNEGRCPCCAERVQWPPESGDRISTCERCGAAWRYRAPVVSRESIDDLAWKARDERGREVRLFNGLSIGGRVEERLGLTKEELRELRKESGESRRTMRWAAVAQLVPALMMTASWIHHTYWSALLPLAYLLLILVPFFIFAYGLNKALFVGAMLRRLRCPHCGYAMARDGHPTTEERVLCAECGCEWRSGVHHGESEARMEAEAGVTTEGH